MAERIWLDGQLVSAAGPHLNVTDRGFQLGDGVFETARARRGVVIELADHLARLHESATALDIRLRIGDPAIVGGIADLLAAEGLADLGAEGEPGDAALRITVSRGPLEGRGLMPAGFDAAAATIAIQAWPYLSPAADQLERGVRAVSSAVRRDPGSPLAGIKSTSRADYVFARLEAARRGADDAIFLTTDGAISEGTSANVWILTGPRLLTPWRASAVLPGTTRTWLLDHGRDLGLDSAEVEVRPDDLLAADEAFLSSSVAGVLPLTWFDGRPVGSGRPGPLTVSIRRAREDWIDEVSRGAAPGPAGRPAAVGR